MPRYEFTEGSSSKFWQIDLKGDTFTTTYGKIGSSGSTSLKQFADAATAKKEHDKLVAEKTKKGYALVGGGKPEPAKKPAKVATATKAAPVAGGAASNPALEKVIDADPDSADGWSVYADWLQAQGDPRGELAVIQERLAADPKNAGLLSAEKKLLKDHRETLIGGYAKYLCRSGKSEIAGVTRKPDLGPDFRGDDTDSAPIRVGWRAGFFAHAYISHPGMDWAPGGKGGDDDEGGGDDGGGEPDMPKLLGEVLASPAARFMTSLTLGLPNSPEDGQTDYTAVNKVLAAHPVAGRLRALFMGDIVYEDSMISSIDLGDLTKLLAAMPKLRSLTLRGNQVKLGAIALPELRELTIISGGLGKKALAAILAAKLPKLEKLELWFGQKTYGSDVTVKDLRPLLDGTVMKTIKHLGLRNCEFADELAAALPGAKIVKQVTALDLSKGTLTEAGVKLLAEGKAAFAHLRKLDLSDNYLGTSEKLASTIMSQVRTKPQRKADVYDGTVYRYPAVGE